MDNYAIQLYLKVPKTMQVERLAEVLADIDDQVNKCLLNITEEYDGIELILPQLDFVK